MVYCLARLNAWQMLHYDMSLIYDLIHLTSDIAELSNSTEIIDEVVTVGNDSDNVIYGN